MDIFMILIVDYFHARAFTLYTAVDTVTTLTFYELVIKLY